MPQSTPGMVSVIMPMHNRARSIEVAVRSVMSQTYTFLELIVVDDASSDEGLALVEKLQREDARVRIIRLNRTLGGGGARNEGIRAACGEFMAFLDSDDKWYPDKLARQMALLRSEVNPSLSVIYCRAHKQEGPEAFDVIPAHPIIEGEHILDYLFIRGGFMQTSSLMMYAELARKVLFRTIPRHQDYDFCLRLQAVGARFVMAPEVLYVWDNQAYPDRISRRFVVAESLTWAHSVKWPSRHTFEQYIFRHKVFLRLARERGLSRALLSLLGDVFRQRIGMRFALRQAWLMFWRTSPEYERAPERDRLLRKVKRSGAGEAAVCGAGRYFQEILPELLALGVVIRCVVDRRAVEGNFMVSGYRVVELSDAISCGVTRFIVASAQFGDDIRAEILSAWPDDRPPPEILSL